MINIIAAVLESRDIADKLIKTAVVVGMLGAYIGNPYIPYLAPLAFFIMVVIKFYTVAISVHNILIKDTWDELISICKISTLINAMLISALSTILLSNEASALTAFADDQYKILIGIIYVLCIVQLTMVLQERWIYYQRVPYLRRVPKGFEQQDRPLKR